MTLEDEAISSLPRQVPILPDTVEGRRCLLMFSGGRDSTLAAVRLGQAGRNLTLVTITSDHLVGIDRVKTRLGELAEQIRQPLRWLNIRQPLDLATDTSFYERTCLPCHHAYVVVSGVVAKSLGIEHLAFGYAAYQSGWPEQSALATARLSEVLSRHGITLELPVYDISTRELAVSELKRFGLSAQSMEQKCLLQVSNVTLDAVRLRAQIDLWEQAINQSMRRLDRIAIEIIEDRMTEPVVQ
jgi:hypothetical protein